MNVSLLRGAHQWPPFPHRIQCSWIPLQGGGNRIGLLVSRFLELQDSRPYIKHWTQMTDKQGLLHLKTYVLLPFFKNRAVQSV